jgi:hypothetical protein
MSAVRDKLRLLRRFRQAEARLEVKERRPGRLIKPPWSHPVRLQKFGQTVLRPHIPQLVFS